jgi:outer membrane protein LpxR
MPFFTRNLHYLGFRLYHENDFIVPGFISKKFFNNPDDNYTGGSKAEIITNLFNKTRFFLLNPLNGDINSLSVLFGYTTYTPQVLADSLIIYDDRPYASYRFWGFGVSSVNCDTSWKLSYEVLLGAMGRPLAGNIQSGMHAFLQHCCDFTREIPQGWKHQVGDSGTFAGNFNLKLEKRICTSKLVGRKKNFRFIQFSARSELNVGNYMTNISLEPRVSLFNLNHNFGEFEDEPGLVSVEKETKRKTIKKENTKNKISFNLFMSIRPKWVIHNATLTGKGIKRASVHTINSSELEPILWEYNFGLAFRWHCFRFGYNLFIRSKEFSFQKSGHHSWGGLYIGSIYQLE